MKSPLDVTKFNRTQSQLETFWLFCLFVAGKNSDYALSCVNRMVKGNTHETPFEALRHAAAFNPHAIYNILLANKVGQYTRLTKAITQSLNLDLNNATLGDLLCVFGVGPKTARFFLVHSRPEQPFAVLDTHVLKWMSKYFSDAPKSTPTTEKVYAVWEQRFLNFAPQIFPNLSFAQIDLLIWSEMSGRA